MLDAFDKGSYVKIMPKERMIVGYTTKNSGGVPDNFKNYFVLKFDHDFTYTAVQRDSTLLEGRQELTADHAMAIVGFNVERGEKVNVKVASSFISVQQAEVNLAEVMSQSFDEVKNAGKEEWNNILGRIAAVSYTHLTLPTICSV